jgi:hypothetical protein
MSSVKITERDIAPFADLGTAVKAGDGKFTLHRNGHKVCILENSSGYFVTSDSHAGRQFGSARSLLASDNFADLAKVARHQTLLLSPRRLGGNPVPVTSSLKGVVGECPEFDRMSAPWAAFDKWLRAMAASRAENGTDLLLIDGPAGVGKTTIISETALLRAEGYSGEESLILQIASRGRVLQNISDLIAYALQDVRSNLTVGQLMPLLRHGLIILAIDGFDELSDPNGFETAWSGLNSLIGDVRGEATFLLAGRETFVSTELIRRQLKFFEESRDRLASLSIADPSPEEAREWLLKQPGWNRSLLGSDFVEPIFDEGSYALRPFFLNIIAREPTAITSDSPPAPDLLSYLVDLMTKREAQKFVDVLDPPEGTTSATDYEEYVGRFLEEVARDLSENQAESIAEDAIDLLATVAADGVLPDDQVPAVIRRARTVVFLANDLRAGHVRFSHEQLLQHFLAREALRSIGEGEQPRYVRRNLFGRESLEVFGQVARGRESEANRFLSAVRTSLRKPSRDRTNSNLAVLGIAAVCAVPPEDADLLIEGVGINELHLPFSAPSGIVFRDSTISMLYAAGADLRKLEFREGVHVATLEIDRQTRLPATMPLPHTLVHEGGTTSNKLDIEQIMYPKELDEDSQRIDWPEDVADLLDRIDRYRTFWLRTNIEETDQQGRRIISHPCWEVVYDALRDLDLVTVRSRQASGTRSDFVHFRRDIMLMEQESLFRFLQGRT